VGDFGREGRRWGTLFLESRPELTNSQMRDEV